MKIGIIGFGRMGRFYLEEIKKSEKWEVAYICDVNKKSRAAACKLSPGTKVTDCEQEIFDDKGVDAVVISALADSRKESIERALHAGKHIISEKPIADTIQNEWDVVYRTEHSRPLFTVNLSLRSAWYHHLIKNFIAQGEIGELAIIRVCHQTPGLMPYEGHEYEGPSFHDCGMHYVDIARWYAGSEYKTWNAQAIRMWSYKDPWWLQCHGTFRNGIVFDITQGHVYGHLAKDQTHNSYVDLIGTKGIARMSHDFNTAVVELHGVNQTIREERPFGEKNMDVLLDLFAGSVKAGRLHPNLPTARDAALASEYAWMFLDNAAKNEMPAIGDSSTIDEILEQRRTLKKGYGLLQHV